MTQHRSLQGHSRTTAKRTPPARVPQGRIPGNGYQEGRGPRKIEDLIVTLERGHA